MTGNAEPAWADWTDEALLNTRLCDLGISLPETPVAPVIERLYTELDAAGLSLHPPCYFADEWFSPGGIPAIAIPFYLAHPRLAQLERAQMLEVEGENESECLKLLRHETGHALCHAYDLPRRASWRRVFGSPGREFREQYAYRPYSRRFVRHLANWYAQSHPEEDFAETFAVWLAPDSDWRSRYRGWPALAKLTYVDGLMQRLRGRPSPPVSRDRPYAAARLRKRLRTHYEERRRLYAEDDPGFFDEDLKRIFPLAADPKQRRQAAAFLRREQIRLLNAAARWTRERKFTVQRLLRKLAQRCEELGLALPEDETGARLEFAACLTALVANYAHTGRFKEGRR